MTPRFIKTLGGAVLLCLLSSLPPLAQAAPDEAILFIEQSSGVAGVQRDGKRLALQPGDALQEQDLIVTERSGRVTLRLGRHGFVEVGPNAEVGVERLPFAAYARDLKSIFSVGKGYFRVVWKHPQLSSNWPLYVYMSGHRISLSSGEYFFQNLGEQQRVCVAAGQIALQAAGSDSLETIKPPACVQLVPNTAPKVTPRNPDDWIAVRRGFSIEATAATLLARDTLPAEPAAPPVAKPIITTAPTPIISVSPPVAIAPVPAPAPAPAPVLAPASASAAPVMPAARAPIIATPVPPPVVVEPRKAPPPVATATAPIIIGQVQTLPAVTPAKAGAAVVAKPPVAGNGTWALNVASYPDAAVAEREALRLRTSGYASTAAQPATISGKTWYRVQVGGFASEALARSAAVELKTKLGLQNVWVLKP